jgi:hypothetical protein
MHLFIKVITRSLKKLLRENIINVNGGAKTSFAKVDEMDVRDVEVAGEQT